jgi:hypothetical protein
MTKPQLLAALLDLPQRQRAELAAALLRSLDIPGEQDIDPEEWERRWGEELDRRIEQVKRGEVQATAADAVFKSMRQRLDETRRGT